MLSLLTCLPAFSVMLFSSLKYESNLVTPLHKFLQWFLGCSLLFSAQYLRSFKIWVMHIKIWFIHTSSALFPVSLLGSTGTKVLIFLQGVICFSTPSLDYGLPSTWYSIVCPDGDRPFTLLDSSTWKPSPAPLYQLWSSFLCVVHTFVITLYCN